MLALLDTVNIQYICNVYHFQVTITDTPVLFIYDSQKLSDNWKCLLFLPSAIEYEVGWFQGICDLLRSPLLCPPCPHTSRWVHPKEMKCGKVIQYGDDAHIHFILFSVHFGLSLNWHQDCCEWDWKTSPQIAFHHFVSVSGVPSMGHSFV